MRGACGGILWVVPAWCPSPGESFGRVIAAMARFYGVRLLAVGRKLLTCKYVQTDGKGRSRW